MFLKRSVYLPTKTERFSVFTLPPVECADTLCFDNRESVSIPLVITLMFSNSERYSAIKKAEVEPSRKMTSPLLISLIADKAIFSFQNYFDVFGK